MAYLSFFVQKRDYFTPKLTQKAHFYSFITRFLCVFELYFGLFTLVLYQFVSFVKQTGLAFIQFIKQGLAYFVKVSFYAITHYMLYTPAGISQENFVGFV